MSSSTYYTPAEDDLLRQRYPTATNADLQALFPSRSLRGLRVRASRLGVKKNLDACETGMSFTGSVIGHLSERDRAYLAGIIDGEGCITLSRRPPKGPNKPIYALYVSIVNTSPALEAWLRSRLPDIAIYRREQRQHWKPIYHWVLSGSRRVMVFLREIAPYLIIKREQAMMLADGYLMLDESERYRLWQALRAAKKTA